MDERESLGLISDAAGAQQELDRKPRQLVKSLCRCGHSLSQHRSRRACEEPDCGCPGWWAVKND
jgi:hypothetical protein